MCFLISCPCSEGTGKVGVADSGQIAPESAAMILQETVFKPVLALKA